MQVKTLRCKAKAVYQLGPSSREMDWRKVEKCAVVWWVRLLSATFKSQHLWWYGVVLVPLASVTCTSVKAPLMLTELPSNQHRFQGRPCFFQQDNAKLHSACATTAWLRSKGVLLPDRPLSTTVRCVMKCKIWQRRPRTVQQIKFYITQELHLQCFNS